MRIDVLDASGIAIYGSMLLAGLAGSLHCVGMCGPILLAFTRLFDAARGGAGVASRPLAGDFVCYHAGRIWTYGILGFAAGWVGAGLRAGGAGIVGQRAVTIALSAAVVASGIALAALVPGSRLDGWVRGCGIESWRQSAWFRGLIEGRSIVARFLLGAVMGLLPCGLVWAMLVTAAALPGPVHGALGMLAFGIGTLPSLSAVLLLDRMFPARLRLHGTRLAGIALIVLGSFMTWRSIADHGTHAGSSHVGAHVDRTPR